MKYRTLGKSGLQVSGLNKIVQREQGTRKRWDKTFENVLADEATRTEQGTRVWASATDSETLNLLLQIIPQDSHF